MSLTRQKQPPEVFFKKGVPKNFENSQESTSARASFLIMLLKKRLWHRCFPVTFAKFLITRLLIEHLRWLLLAFQSESALYSFTTSCSKQAQYLKFKWAVTSRKYSRSNIPQTICLCYMAGFSTLLMKTCCVKEV